MANLTSFLVLACMSIAITWSALAPSQLMARFAIMAREAVIGSYSRLMLIAVISGLVLAVRTTFASPQTHFIDTSNTPWDPIAALVIIAVDVLGKLSFWQDVIGGLTLILGVVWATGVAVRLIQAKRSLTEGFRAAACAARVEICDLSQSLKDALENQRIQIRVSNEDVSPFTVGHFDPVIVLPSRLLQNDAREHLEPVIAHELAHIERADFVKNIGLQLFASLLWINPPLQRLAEGYGVGVELACDRRTLDYGVTRRSLAQAIAFLGDCSIDQAFTPTFLGGGHESHLRVKALIASQTPRSWAVSLTNAVALLTTTVLVGVLFFLLHKVEQTVALTEHRSNLVENAAQFNLVLFQRSVRTALIRGSSRDETNVEPQTLTAQLSVTPTDIRVDDAPVSENLTVLIRQFMEVNGVLPDASFQLNFDGANARFRRLDGTLAVVEQISDPMVVIPTVGVSTSKEIGL